MKTAASFLALSCVGFIATAPAYAADSAPAADAASVDMTADGADPQLQNQPARDDILVTDKVLAPPPELESPKATGPLLDTPQTVTVISDQVLRKQNLLTLRDALQTVPGITFGAGEGGGGYGDSINLRGYSANTDVTIDGVRDSAQYSRTDPFNLQQIEVYNGANSVFNGSGSVGGTINLVSKAPRPESLTIVQGAVGTDNYYRGSIDSNVRASEFVAVRLNAMYHRNDVPGRDVEKFKRWGVAPSVTLGIDGPTSLTLAYVHQRDDNTPIFGVPYFKSLVNDGPLPGVDDSDYYGIVNLDEQEQTLDRATATFRHDFSDSVGVRNLTRWQRVHSYTQTSAPQGTFCLANGLQPVGASGSATVGIACPTTLRPGQYQPSGPRGLARDQRNDLFYNQTDLRIVSGERGGIRNTLNVGGALIWEDYSITTASLPRTSAGAAVTLPALSLFSPDTTYTGLINKTVTAISRAESRSAAIYAFDTLELGEHFELNGGVRYENVKTTFRGVPLLTVPPGTVALTDAQAAPQVNDETLFSYRVGAVFKPTASTSLYAAFGNAKTPSSANVRAGCGVISAPGAADPCATAPETARNYEIGGKADVFGGRLQLTAAVFRNERTNFRVPSNDPASPAALQVLDGKSRVDGVALGATGEVVRGLTLFANYTYLDGEVLQSVSDFCLRSPGAAGCGNTAALPDPQAGQRLVQTPKHSGSLFASYRLPFGLEVGYGVTYQGSFALTNRQSANLVQVYSDDYWVHRGFLAYTIGNGLTAQLNVQNLTNAKYYTGIRNNVSTSGANIGAITGGWAIPSERRSAVLSLFYNF